MSQEMPETMDQETNNTTCTLHGNNTQLGSFCECDLKRKADHRKEKTVIAQPVFVFENKDQAFKRPAEDTLDKEEYGVPCSSKKHVQSLSFTFHEADTKSESTSSQKQMRSSSFVVLPTFPPSRPVKKKNVFMTTVLQWNADAANTERGSRDRSQQCSILRPAILQPPQSQRCEERNVLVHAKAMGFYKTTDEGKTDLSEENPHMLNETSSSTGPLVKTSTSLHLLNPTHIRRQPDEDRSTLQIHSSDFIFGENMNERVLNPQKCFEFHQEKDPNDREKPFTSSFPLYFSCKSSCQNITLKESAAAFSSKSSPKCILEKIEVITGEEEEYNVLTIKCKLYVFNKTIQSWTERGRGTLRLNDTADNNSGMLQSRLIMRHQGSLRLILNSKLWAQMDLQRASLKSLYFNATDLYDCSIKIFLIQASTKDVGCLYEAMHHRLVALRAFYKQELDVNETERVKNSHPVIKP